MICAEEKHHAQYGTQAVRTTLKIHVFGMLGSSGTDTICLQWCHKYRQGPWRQKERKKERKDVACWSAAGQCCRDIRLLIVSKVWTAVLSIKNSNAEPLYCYAYCQWGIFWIVTHGTQLLIPDNLVFVNSHSITFNVNSSIRALKSGNQSFPIH